MKKTIALLLLSTYVSSEILIHTSNYIDGINDKILKKASIVVGDDGRIKSISSGYINSKGYEYVDLRDYIVMPGLMDKHVHFGQQNVSKAERPEKVEKEYSAIAAVKHARMTLDGGFTTVRQVGDSGFIAISLRDAIKNGDAVGPRIYAAGKSWSRWD